MAPLDDVVNTAMLPTARAAAFLQQNDPADALLALEPPEPFDLYVSMQMVPDYYRGLAYLQNKQPELAGGNSSTSSTIGLCCRLFRSTSFCRNLNSVTPTSSWEIPKARTPLTGKWNWLGKMRIRTFRRCKN
jgi:hypothetical protein